MIAVIGRAATRDSSPPQTGFTARGQVAALLATGFYRYLCQQAAKSREVAHIQPPSDSPELSCYASPPE